MTEVESSRTHFEVLGIEGQVLENCPVLGSRTAHFFEVLKFCRSPEKKFYLAFFNEERLKKFLEELFFGEDLRLCPWPREGLSSEELSLALDFFVSLALSPRLHLW